MAKVRVSAAMIEEFLFEGSEGIVVITNASFDQYSQCITFDIEGSAVPKDADKVACEITQKYRTCRFVSVDHLDEKPKPPPDRLQYEDRPPKR